MRNKMKCAQNTGNYKLNGWMLPDWGRSKREKSTPTRNDVNIKQIDLHPRYR